MTAKIRRQREVIAILESRDVGSQEQLMEALSERGVEVSQATLSRDLRELGVVRVPSPEGYGYALPKQESLERLRRLAALEILAVESNEALVLVKTWPGRAQGVGVYLDAMGHPELLGTVAGDDTIIVVPRSAKRTARLRRAMEELMGEAERKGGTGAARAGSLERPPRRAPSRRRRT